MVAAANILQFLHRKVLLVACDAHLLHNCAMKVESQLYDVNQVTAKVKAAFIKYKTRQSNFTTVDYPLEPVVTQWGNKLKAAFCYLKNTCLKL